MGKTATAGTGYDKRVMYIFLLVLVVGVYTAFQGWRTLINNFAVEVGHFNGQDMGLVQSLREVPGFLVLLAIYVIMIIREHRLAAISVLVLGAGVAMTGLFPTVWGVAFTTLIMSFGFHYFETMNQSLTLQYFSHTEAPLVMGRVRAVGALTNVCVGGAVLLLIRWMDYGWLFAVLGGVAVMTGIWGLTRDPSDAALPPQRKTLRLKGRYWLYYALTFMSGARRQIFVAFAVFLLVERFHYDVAHITVLFMANNVINFVVNPLIGRAVNRFGERAVLSLEYGSLLVIFSAYALTDSALVAGGLYILDNIVFNFAMAIKTFYQKIADPGDIASGMAMGFTINHVVAVAVPLLGGLVWMVDYRAVFWGGAAMSLISLILSQLVVRELKKNRAAG